MHTHKSRRRRDEERGGRERRRWRNPRATCWLKAIAAAGLLSIQELSPEGRGRVKEDRQKENRQELKEGRGEETGGRGRIHLRSSGRAGMRRGFYISLQHLPAAGGFFPSFCLSPWKIGPADVSSLVSPHPPPPPSSRCLPASRPFATSFTKFMQRRRAQ